MRCRIASARSAAAPSMFTRWYYSHEALRNNAANLVREAGFGMQRPERTRLLVYDR